MIRRLSPNERLFPPVREGSPVYGRIKAYYKAYGAGYDFCGFYCGDGIVAMLYGGELFISASEHINKDNVLMFIKAVPHFSLVSDIQLEQGGEPLMYMAGSFERKLHPDILTEDYKAVYSVLADAFSLSGKEDHDRWYTDICHRVRHGISSMLLLYRDNIPAATATAVYRDGGAFLSHVGVIRSLQGKGLGRKLILSAGEIYGDISLLCHENVAGFYRSCGLTHCGTAYSYIRNGDKE